MTADRTGSVDIEDETFDGPPETRPPDGPLVIDIDGYAGPLDVLLALARTQKVDLTHISILQLAEQFLAFVTGARSLHLEVAADYLVMAAWLAYLKSRLLLPDEESEGELSGTEMAARLRHQLQRLEAIREAGHKLMMRHRLGRDVFARGDPEAIRVIKTPVFAVSLYELLKGYAAVEVRAPAETLRIDRNAVYRIEDAIRRLARLLGKTLDWETLEDFLPPGMDAGFARRNAIASTLAASLQLAREGKLELRQTNAFGPVYVRAKEHEE